LQRKQRQRKETGKKQRQRRNETPPPKQRQRRRSKERSREPSFSWICKRKYERKKRVVWGARGRLVRVKGGEALWVTSSPSRRWLVFTGAREGALTLLRLVPSPGRLFREGGREGGREGEREREREGERGREEGRRERG
jgi:hypothetical protein